MRGSRRTVDQVSVQARSDSVLCLLGPNGAGKTTTLKAIAGLFPPQSGEIRLNGELQGVNRTRRIALIPEVPVVYGLLTVWEHLEFVARSCRLQDGWRDTAVDLLRGLDLYDRRNMLGHELSKGMRQKTLIAATLLSDAMVFLFDEPTLGLDVAAQAEIKTLIARMRSRAAVIVSTHQIDFASAVSDELVIMRAGRIARRAKVSPEKTSATAMLEVYADAIA
jgi:ABC-2 type transport system ATP-binding protein